MQKANIEHCQHKCPEGDPRIDDEKCVAGSSLKFHVKVDWLIGQLELTMIMVCTNQLINQSTRQHFIYSFTLLNYDFSNG